MSDTASMTAAAEARRDAPVERLFVTAVGAFAGGAVVVADERVPDAVAPPGDEVERLYYGFSVLHRLPVGMVGENAAGTGTVMRTQTVRSYAERAGFGRFEVLPIENDFYRFYLMC